MSPSKQQGAPLATRMSGIATFQVLKLLARAKELEAQGRSVIHMEIGEPDFPTPAPVTAAALEATRGGDVHYLPALGLPALRRAISGYYRDHHGVEVSPERIIVTPGSSGALLLAMGVLLCPGDEVLMADPSYPANRHFVRFCEGVPVGIPCGPETGYQLTAAMIAANWTERTRAVMVATPANPTGTTIPGPELQRIVDEVQSRGAALVVDEIYHGLVYGERSPTALALTDKAFVINGFSKFFTMTGWRLGWIVVPEAYHDPAERLAQNLFLACSTVAQHAALAAFSPESIAICERQRAEFRERRDYLAQALIDLGFRIPVIPEGAFYLYADCSALTDDSFAFALDMLERSGVAITPGADFGIHRAHQHVRFAYTTSMASLREGVQRIAAHLRERAASSATGKAAVPAAG
ncbi:MAG: pyridoxal phosphate-dependent aminotransferase [bacterium]|jgi:aspartate/methionine/tyrosine aminotransferase|nr:pyridoxal phosphate-dependent aminotransferase [Betaproteobacteria bacterium]